MLSNLIGIRPLWDVYGPHSNGIALLYFLSDQQGFDTLR